MFELVEINNNEVSLKEEASLRLSMLLKQEIEIKLFKERLKEELTEAFEKTNKTTYEDNNIKITKRKGSTRTTIDSKRLKEEKPEIYEEYSKTSVSSPSISFEVK